MTLQRMQHAGAAPATQLSGNISAGATSMTLQSGTGYPDGSVGPFILKIDAGTASEEKVLCLSRSGTTVTVVTSPSTGRGYDNTVASAHSNGAAVEHDLGAIEIDDANDHIYTTTRDDHTQYARTDGTRVFTGGITAPTVSATNTGTGRYVGSTNGSPSSGPHSTGDFADDPTNGLFWICTAGGTPGTWLSVGTNGAWTSFTPAWSATGSPPAIGNGSLFGHYALQGKVCTVFINITAGTTTTFGSGGLRLSLPVAPRTGAVMVLHGFHFDGTSNFMNAGIGRTSSPTQTVDLYTMKNSSASALASYSGVQTSTSDVYTLTGTYETS